MNVRDHSSLHIESAEAARSVYGLGAPLTCLWMLILLTFSAPGRVGPESADALDWIAVAKLASRLIAAAFLGVLWLRNWNHRRRPLIVWAMFPWVCFAAWAIVSVLWSALPSVTLGQSFGLIVQLMLTAVFGLLCVRPRHAEVVLKNLSWALLLISSAIIVVDRMDHSISGLDRTLAAEGSLGIVHPTSAGATASLGIVILFVCHLIWRWRWATQLLVPGGAIHGTLLALAASRTALGLTLVVVLAALALFGYRTWLAAAAVCASAVGILYLSIDPQLAAINSVVEQTTAYASRGESTEQMGTLTGRTQLWEAIGEEYRLAPLQGHGYFVTSHTGALDVWSGPDNRTAHNVFLQVLVTTGWIGTILFLWAMLRPIRLIVGDRISWESADARRRWLAFLALLGGWYLGWGQLCESFMGPIQPESIVFYSIFGLALGRVASR